MSNVLEFTDYRAFLRAAFQDAKTRNPRFSYSGFARKLGLKSNTSIIKILRGQREAGPEMVEKIGDAFGFGEKERRYLGDLVLLSKVRKGSGESVALMERVKRYHREFRLLDESEFSAISQHWYYTIRQMTRLAFFHEDPRWISRQLLFPVPPREVKRALETMLHMGLLVRDPHSGKVTLGQARLNTSDDVASEALRRFHESMIANAREAVRKVEPRDRLIVGLTLGIRRTDLAEARKFLDQMLDEFEARFESERPDVVYQAQIQFFPLTKFEIERKMRK